MSEKTLRRHLKDCLPTSHIVQIESHATANGVPDTNLCLNGREHWIELKCGTPKKPWHVRPSQKSWFRRRARAGADNLWILWRYDDAGSVTHGIIHMAPIRMDAVFQDTSPSFWRYASARTWGPTIDTTSINMLLGDINALP